jgi:DNA-binding CsgD family transcriptional regulator
VLKLPGPLRLPLSTPFVGRSRELATLRTLVPRVEGEGGRVALVGGEPGSGKSRLVREFAQEVAEEGVLVLYGACDADVRVPYRPFVEALDHLVRDLDVDLLRSDLGATGGELTRLLPDLPARVGDLPGPVEADPDTERLRLHRSVADLLANASRRQPLLLVLEDGHWADAPSLQLLRHLARGAAGSRVLVVATFRDTEADVPSQLAEALADLRRLEDVVRLRLDGLTGSDVEEFVRRAIGGDAPVSAELSGGLRELTEGNAFLLCELWRTLVETGGLVRTDGVVTLDRPLEDIATPDSVREVVSQRLARLGPVTRDLLELAAVAGPEFDLELLRRAAADRAGWVEALEPAVRSGLIEEVPSTTLGYRFAHELVRRALYDRLSALRRAELHLQIGEALEATQQGVSGRAADLAHHFEAAAPVGGRDRAVEYNLLAAEAASAGLAHDEAAARLRAALRVGIRDDRRRGETLLALGTALFRAGASLDSIQAFREAAQIARASGDGELLARAAIGLENACWRPGIHDQGARETLEEASAAFQAEDSRLRVRLLGGLARALEFQGEHRRAAVVRDSAIEMARRLDDGRGLATVLMQSYWGQETATLPVVLEMLTEARDLAGTYGDIEIQAEAMEWRIAALMALGEISAARTELAVTLEMAERMQQPFILHVAEHYRSALALLGGNLDEADAAAERSREWGQLLTGRDASGVYGIQMFGVRREQGRLAELAPVVRVLASPEREGGSWRPGLAALLAELGMEAEVKRELEQIRRVGLDRFREALWIASLTYLTDAASAVEDEQVAELVYRELTPFAGTNVMIGHGVSCYGSADRYLGMLAAVLGERAQAELHFEAALTLDRAMGARTWLAHTAYEYGRMLADAGKAERSAVLLAEAQSLAEEVGMPTLLARIRALGGSRTAALPDALSPREVDVLRLVARGLSNREIGAELFISEHTAANHVRSILRKTSSSNRTEATAYAYRRGLA